MTTKDGDDTSVYRTGLAMDVAEISRVAVRDRWGLPFMAVGWVHLVIFLACYTLISRGDRTETHFLALWAAELAAVVVIYRKTIGDRARGPAPALLTLGVRVWITFLILSLNVASLNTMTGLENDWFKPIWGTLSTFGFATMAWVFHLAFLIPAVQMSLTGLLLARYPDHAYAIYGVSWWLALHGIGLTLEHKRAMAGARDACPLEGSAPVASPG
ncbi:hypothetical protein TA3x_003035 [Tundrisphaera sp. TA3]|uniref:hypothetical protein n=1 Tax=Tundrisphaera sp. TA3 TaxID=3435775 RepID=UPI003EBB6F02